MPDSIRPNSITPETPPIANRVEILILQHPQEQDRVLGTATLTVSRLANAKLSVGLSWPNLTKPLGRPSEPKGWGVLYLGSAVAMPEQPIVATSKSGAALPDQQAALAAIKGIVLLDGSWTQAKALWWRNPWLLRLQRLVLNPPRPSLYGRLRHEPRRESVSTLEATAMALGALERNPAIEAMLVQSFEAMLRDYRQARQGTVG